MSENVLENDRPEGLANVGEDSPSSRIPDEIIVVPHRPARHSAKLLPPILILLLGVAFLIYRSRVSDWRGLSAFESWSDQAAASAPAPEKPALALKVEPPLPEAQAPLEQDKQVKSDSGPPVAEGLKKDETPKATEAPKAAEVDPLDDIKQEAEKTKQRLAELEKLKEKEKDKLAATEGERRRQDQIERRNNPRFGMFGPGQIDQLIQAQREMLRRQMAMIEEMQKRHMDSLPDDARELFGRMRPFALEMPDMMPFPDMRPRFGFDVPPRAPGPQNEKGQVEEGVRKLPGGGIQKFKRFQGPGGMTGFVYEFRFGGADPDNSAPPPPAPGLGKRRDARPPKPPTPRADDKARIFD